MAEPKHRRPVCRLLRLAVTIGQNLALLIFICGFVVGQRMKTEVTATVPSFVCSVGIASQGWQVIFGAHNSSGFELLYASMEPKPDAPWGAFWGAEVISFSGGYYSRYRSSILFGVKHWLVLFVVTMLQGFHHRWLIARLVRWKLRAT